MTLTDKELDQLLKRKNNVYTTQDFTTKVFLAWIKDNKYRVPKFRRVKGVDTYHRPSKALAHMVKVYFTSVFRQSIDLGLPTIFPNMLRLIVYETDSIYKVDKDLNIQVETPFDVRERVHWFKYKLFRVWDERRARFRLEINPHFFFKTLGKEIKKHNYPKDHFPFISHDEIGVHLWLDKRVTALNRCLKRNKKS